MDKAKSFAKRDHLIKYELESQEFWSKHKVNEADPDSRPKYMMTFPYPYMNGKLHLGHYFSSSKNEFAARFKRLQGYNVLWPFGFHCTGSPINAAADQIQKELKEFADPKTNIIPVDKVEKTKWYKILHQMGIEEKDIGKFADANMWLEYFPPIGQTQLTRMGFNIDWRRSMITTSRNPFYDNFIKWQFNTLKKNQHLGYGLRPCVFSRVSKNPCMDHDRASGEGVGYQEFTLVKMEVITKGVKYCERVPTKIASQKNKVYLVAATLRPETMYGQTNCYVLPEGEYLGVRTKENEIWVISANAAENLSFQNKTKEFGKYETVFKVTGKELIGVPVKAPLSKYPYVYVLPMLTVKLDRCTGVVTSVPSDSPDDLITYRELQDKEFYRKPYDIQMDMLDRELVPILEIPEIGNMSAPYALEKFKVVSHKDAEKLKEAKDLTYKKGFEEGTMIIGEFYGMPVKQAKVEVKKKLLESGEGEVYYETESEVISRNGDKCIIALVDQWYIKYGEGEWNRVLNEFIDNKFKTYNDQTAHEFKYTANWLGAWACSRTYGLGTVIPWDTKFKIESLSDSTIYWAYYIAKPYLHSDIFGDNLVGALKPADCDDAFFDYIFNKAGDNKQLNATCKKNIKTLDQIKKDFNYWYPIDLRCSGKDLIRNHLTMAMYNHIGVWGGDKYLPRSYFCNGYIQVDNEKMSKSKGNFYTIEDMANMYGADASRLGCADAGDTHEDSNFINDICNTGILRLNAFEGWIDEMLKKPLRKEDHVYDKLFLNQVKKHMEETYKLYDQMKFKMVLKEAYFQLMDLKEEWIAMTDLPKLDVLVLYLKCVLTAISPITPHWAHSVWTAKLVPFCKKNKVPIQSYLYFSDPKQEQRWERFTVDEQMVHQRDIVMKTIQSMRSSLDNMKKKSKTVIDSGTIVVAKTFPESHKRVITLMKSLGVNEKNQINGNLFEEMKKVFPDKKELNNGIKFAKYYEVNEVKFRGEEALNSELSYNEVELYRSMVKFFKSQLLLKNVYVISVEDKEPVSGMPDVKGMYDNIIPEKPNFTFWSASGELAPVQEAKPKKEEGNKAKDTAKDANTKGKDVKDGVDLVAINKQLNDSQFISGDKPTSKDKEMLEKLKSIDIDSTKYPNIVRYLNLIANFK